MENIIVKLSSTHGAGPRFQLGRILATPGAIEALANAGVATTDLLIRHLRGDWGDIPESDRQQNDLALTAGERLLSSYPIAGAKIWVITEADRSATTLLLPDEY
ncbi:hypothetical protein [Burkholderia pseudomallei]|uniref:hypothetical protein n=1 Tax=Burkholderia pseudomallei TaxID=28450 RepID=UPI0021F6AA3C|nr:hypothetical protein [Burkholderia pseudomallei]MCW0080582.1 hypothetical protein [Burkholderia pseudomallei]